MVIVVALVNTAKANAASNESTRQQQQQQIHFQQKRFNHADGFIKCIGHVAYRTIYSSDMLTRVKWKLKLKKLMEVRRDADFKLDKLRTPRLPTPPHLSALICIHGYEGSWSTNTGNGYFGGLQMDLGFQRTYAAALHDKMHYPNLLTTKGTADHWTPKEQLWVAEMAILSRGFYPWPNTARYCGLI